MEGLAIGVKRGPDIVFAITIGIPLVYETYAVMAKQELLSMAMDKYRVRYPVLSRIFFVTVFGHLGGLLPPQFDLFSEHNILHELVKSLWRRLPTPPWCRWFASILQKNAKV